VDRRSHADRTIVLLVVTFASQAATSGAVMLRHRYSQQAAQDLVHAHAWHLRQLLPAAELSSTA